MELARRRRIEKPSAGAFVGRQIGPAKASKSAQSAFLASKRCTRIEKDLIKALKDNSNYFRDGLTKLGLQVLGDYDSPVMPILLYNPTKIAAFSRECLKRGLAVVSVGFPATPVISSRARFCVARHSAAILISSAS